MGLQRTLLGSIVALVAILLLAFWNELVAALLALVLFGWLIVTLARTGR